MDKCWLLGNGEAKNHYQLLEIDKMARPEIIKAAFRVMSSTYHPDRNSSPEAAEMMALVNVAYDTLMSDEKRNSYDSMLRFEASCATMDGAVTDEDEGWFGKLKIRRR